MVGKKRGEVHTVGLMGKPEALRLLGRCRHRWEYNIKMDLYEVEPVSLSGRTLLHGVIYHITLERLMSL